MEIHADPITINCRKVLAGLQLMGAPYKLVHVDYFKGAQKEMPYIGLNPNASVRLKWGSRRVLRRIGEGGRAGCVALMICA